MARKAYLDVKIRLVVEMEEGVTVNEFTSDMDYDFKSQTDGASVLDTEIIDYEVTYSK